MITINHNMKQPLCDACLETQVVKYNYRVFVVEFKIDVSTVFLRIHSKQTGRLATRRHIGH